MAIFFFVLMEYEDFYSLSTYEHQYYVYDACTIMNLFVINFTF